MILGATLYPVPGAERVPLTACLICGGRGVADAILNVFLFLPLGVALALVGLPWRYAAVVALVLSSGIELTQVAVPGRDPSWGDLVFNTVGGALGCLVTQGVSRWVALAAPAPTGLWLVSLTGAAGIFVLTGTLAQPAFPASTYYGQWAVYLGAVPWYRFHVVRASVADEPLPPRRLARSSQVRKSLTSGPQITVNAFALLAVSPSRRVIGIYDVRLREIVRLASSGNDLILSYRMGSAALRLDRPTFRFANVLQGIRPGDAVRITVSGQWQKPCVEVNRAGACAAGLTLGSGWKFLMDVASLSTWLQATANVIWIFCLALPIGLSSASARRAALGGAAIVIALLLLPSPVNLACTPVLELAAGVLGVASGFALRMVVIARGRRAPHFLLHE